MNVTAGLALATSHTYFYAGFQTRSIGYLARYVTPVAYLLPINLLEDFSKPLSLSFRLLGNIMADELTIAVLSSLVAFIVPVAVMCLGIFTSAIQALVFATLAGAYIAEATEVHAGAGCIQPKPQEPRELSRHRGGPRPGQNYSSGLDLGPETQIGSRLKSQEPPRRKSRESELHLDLEHSCRDHRLEQRL